MQTHCFVFCAIAVLTQLWILNGEPLFDVDYRDPEKLSFYFIIIIFELYNYDYYPTKAGSLFH